MHSSAAAVQVLTDHSLFANIMASASGTPFFVVQVYRQLECARNKRRGVTFVGKHIGKVLASATSDLPDVTLWKDAVRTGDKRTLEALHVLSASTKVFGDRLRKVLRGVFDFALTLTRNSGDTSLVDWLYVNGMFTFDGVSPSLAFQFGEQGDLMMLRWMHEHGYHIHRDVAGGAASSGNLDVLLFLQSVGPENATTDESAVSCAAENGHLHVIELLIQQSEEDIGKWMDVAYTSAIQVGQLHVVRYMHENGYECRHGDICKAAENGHVDVVRYMLENRVGIDANDALDRAARRGHLEVVKLLCANGWVLSNYRVFEDVIKNDSFDILQILCQSGIDGAVRCAMVAAVKLGKLEFVKFLHELDPVGCADEGGYLTADAAERGYLDIIKFWYECGDPRFSLSQAMHCASMSGHLDIVKFLHENGYGGCKKYSLEHAYEQGHHDVVDFLCEHLPALNADELVRFLGRNTFPDLAEKIERGAAAAVSGGRKLYRYSLW